MLPESLQHVPVLIKVLGSLAVIVLLSRVFKQLYWPILFGTCTLAIWSGQTPETAAKIAFDRVVSLDNLFFVVIILQVIALSEQMARTGRMRELVRLVKARISQRTAIAALPAIIGFLPMPGGAIFSAPLVDDCDERKEIDPMLKTQINYWFRHVWEYGWPLYPGVILAIEITGLDAWQFVLLQAPLCGISIILGYHFLLRRIPAENGFASPHGDGEPGHESIVSLLLPIILVISAYVLIRIFFPSLSEISRFVPMALGLLVAGSLLQCQRALTKEEWESILFSKSMANMVVLVLLVRIYGAFIESDLPDGRPIVEAMRLELAAFGIPMVLAIMTIPFICGFTMGLAIGFVGASFPIVVSLLGPDPGFGTLLSTTSLAFTFGYMGMMLSPIHICLIVTNEHFRTCLIGSIRSLIAPAMFMLGAGFLYFLLVRTVFFAFH